MRRRLLFAISCLVFLWDCVLDSFRRLSGIGDCPRQTILVYHDVRDSERGAFARQMRWLKRHATPCGDRVLLGGKGARNGVLVTFDDAYEGIFRNALPALRERQIPCVIFVPVGCLGALPSWKQRSAAARGESRVASAERLRDSADELIRFGAHGVKHLSLTEATEAEARVEIVESKERLEAILGEPVTLLAFAYGHYEEKHVEWCRSAGYEAVFGVNPRGRRRVDDGFLRFRTSTSPTDGWAEYLLKIKGAYRWHGRLSVVKRSMRRVLGAGANAGE